MTIKESILPGATLGMLGGGQLGGFFAEAALRMGYKVAVWDPDPNAPAKRFSHFPVTADFEDSSAYESFTNQVNATSLEWENVPVSLTEKMESDGHIVRPGSNSLELAQNRIKEKAFLKTNGLPVTGYETIKDPNELENLLLPLPWIVKTATLGYDGHGQWRINDQEEVQTTIDAMGTGGPWVVEKVVPFMKELSVVVSSNGDGTLITYPSTENLHWEGILKTSISPARIEKSVDLKARELASTVVRFIGDPGVFCVELFLLEDESILVNEIAPRPHNSGHHTIDTFSISQYEQQIRTLCNLPVINPIQHSKSVLLNVLGYEAQKLRVNSGLKKVVQIPTARIYMYGKEEIRDKRKMGHILFVGHQIDELIKTSQETQSILSDNQEY
mgnify:FL=1